MATVVPTDDFDASADSATLKAAMKGLGTDEGDIIGVVARRTNDERQQIISEYRATYEQDLIADLKSELGGDFENAVIALMSPLGKYDTRELFSALTADPVDVDTLIEILCTRSGGELAEISQFYAAEFQRNLAEDVRNNTSAYVGRLLTCQVTMGTEDQVTGDLTEAEGQEILQIANRLLRMRNYTQLKAAFDQCADLTGREMVGIILDETKEKLSKELLALVRTIHEPKVFFAERVYSSLKGIGTDDRGLIRIIVSRAEIDLGEIMEVFLERYGQSLAEMVEDDISGDYKRLLLKIIGI